MAEPANRQPLVLTVAPNGSRAGPWDHPAVPLTPDALAATAAACRDAGAAVFHLHVRDADGGHSLDAWRYRAALEAIRARVGDDLVLQVTTEAAGLYAPPEQMALVRELEPEAVSLAIAELVPDPGAENDAREFFGWLAQRPIQVQLILYSASELERYQALRAGGVIPEMPHWLLFVLGRHASDRTAAPLELLPFLDRHDGAVPWAACAFGAREHACTVAAAALGGHLRVGFENNFLLRDGSTAPDNAALVAQSAEAARALGRPLASADDVRAMFRGAKANRE